MVTNSALPRVRVAKDGSFKMPTPKVDVGTLKPMAYAGQQVGANWESSIYDGSKFAGGFGETQLYQVDYWTLRARSAQLFEDNLYAKGLIRRLITNEINTGLTPESCPDEEIIGLEPSSLDDWTETVENRFQIWANAPKVCDYKQAGTFASIQRAARMEALVAGDVLVVTKINPLTNMPSVQLIAGDKVRTPLSGAKLALGHEIKHGVEFNAVGRVVAHWVSQSDGSSKRLLAYGARSGRRISWLVFGTDKRLDDVRGQPILSLVLQSLKEIDRYRDAALRKAVINSVLAMFIEKGEDKMGTLPMTGGAVRSGSIATPTADSPDRKFNIAQQMPGLVLQELQHGEKPVGFGGEGTDINFPAFEAAVINSIAWANEMPAEILTLAFTNNYSASQAAINEFKIYLNKVWSQMGESFCTPIYNEWLISEALLGKIKAPGMIDAWRDPAAFDVFGAWSAVEWYGSIKPSTDMLKQAKGSKLVVEEGWSTNARESRAITGTKFSKNIKRLKRENEQKVEAMLPIAQFKQEYGEQAVEHINALESVIYDALENKANE